MCVVKGILILTIFALTVTCHTFDDASNIRSRRATESRQARSVPSVADRANCGQGDEEPNVRVDTTNQVAQLRVKMAEAGIQAFIIPMDDSHQSEYVANRDKRVQFISGFSGSAAKVVITAEHQALWTDGRYFLQGEDELDCNWILMKKGLPDVPSIGEWLGNVLDNGDKVGADSSCLSYDSWQTTSEDIIASGKTITLEEVANNPLDQVWDAWSSPARPQPPVSDIIILNETFAGESWQSKVDRIRAHMPDGVTSVVVTALDESVWLFNIRGSDVKYNPVLFSYTIITKDRVTLYIYDHTSRLSNSGFHTHLNTPINGWCTSNSNCVNVKDYGNFFADLTALSNENGKVWVSPMSSYKVYSTVKDKIHQEPSIVRLLKGRKNPTEVEGMRKCHIRDSAALIEFVTELESDVKAGRGDWTEISASDRLEEIRRQQLYMKGLSFETISAVGSNGAIIHYGPSAVTNTKITDTEMYLLDSGGQYLDGTTDVTRTFHFGTPTDFEKEAYTRVLMGSIDLALARWPNGTFGRDIDVLARNPLWSAELNYRHGTGHGLGAFLNVHEGPGRINIGYRETAHESPMYGEMFFSDEPGYYEDGKFGVRLETIVMTTKIENGYGFGDKDWLGFEEFTLVPFEPNLINYDLLGPRQRTWLNEYNKKCLEKVGEDVLKAAGKTDAYEWVVARTKHIPEVPKYDDVNGVNINQATICVLFAAVFAAFIA